MNLVTAAILGYVVLQLGIAFYVAPGQERRRDYLVASLAASGSAWASSPCSRPGSAPRPASAPRRRRYGGELALDQRRPFGYALCLVLMGLFFAVPLYRRGLTTLADLFRARFGTRVGSPR